MDVRVFCPSAGGDGRRRSLSVLCDPVQECHHSSRVRFQLLPRSDLSTQKERIYDNHLNVPELLGSQIGGVVEDSGKHGSGSQPIQHCGGSNVTEAQVVCVTRDRTPARSYRKYTGTLGSVEGLGECNENPA